MEEALDPVAAAERMRNPDVAGEDGSDREHDERQRHRRRRIVWSVPMSAVAVRRAPLAVEGQEHEPEHVNRRQQRRHGADQPQDLRPVIVIRLGADERPVENLVLAEEPGEQRNAGNVERAERAGLGQRTENRQWVRKEHQQHLEQTRGGDDGQPAVVTAAQRVVAAVPIPRIPQHEHVPGQRQGQHRPPAHPPPEVETAADSVEVEGQDGRMADKEYAASQQAEGNEARPPGRRGALD